MEEIIEIQDTSESEEVSEMDETVQMEEGSEMEGTLEMEEASEREDTVAMEETAEMKTTRMKDRQSMTLDELLAIPPGEELLTDPVLPPSPPTEDLSSGFLFKINYHGHFTARPLALVQELQYAVNHWGQHRHELRRYWTNFKVNTLEPKYQIFDRPSFFPFAWLRLPEDKDANRVCTREHLYDLRSEQSPSSYPESLACIELNC